MSNDVDRAREKGVQSTKAQEVRSFVFLTAIMTPILAVIVVGGYGFVVWIYQILAGPPTG